MAEQINVIEVILRGAPGLPGGEKGDPGDPGHDGADSTVPGPQGPQGIHGGGITMRLVAASFTGPPSSLGNGQIVFNGATQLVSTSFWVSDNDVMGANIEGNHAAIDNVINPPAGKAIVRLSKETDLTRWVEYVVQEVTDLTANHLWRYDVLGVSSSPSASPFVSGDPLVFSASPYGNKGEPGASTAEAEAAAAAAAASAAAAAASADDAAAAASSAVDEQLDLINAAVFAAQDAASEAVNAFGLNVAHSTSSVAVGGGGKTFIIEAGKNFPVTQYVIATSQSQPLAWMIGQVASYSGSSLIVNVSDIGPIGGTFNDWTITWTSPRGPKGDVSAPGSTTSATSLTSATGSKTLTVAAAGLNFPIGQVVLVQSAGQPGTWMLGPVTAYSGTSMTINATDIGPTAGTRSDWNVTWSSPRGPQGNDGLTGAAGVAGQDGGLRWRYSISTSGDPGGGFFRFNNTIFTSADKIAFSETDQDGNNASAFLAALDDNNVQDKAVCILRRKGGTGIFQFLIRNAITDNGAYDEFTIFPLPGGASGTPVAGEDYYLTVALVGNKGDTGLSGPGSGDMLGSVNLQPGAGGGVANGRASLDNISIHGANIASAATLNLETATGDLVAVTGTATITAIVLGDGHERTVIFTATPTLVFNAGGSSNPIFTIGGADVAVQSGDVAVFRGMAGGTVQMVGYSRPLGQTFIQSASGLAFAVGPNGFTNSSFLVDTSAALAATGWKAIAAAAGGGASLVVISSGTNENGKLDAKGSGKLTLQGTATGIIEAGRSIVPVTNDGAALGVAGTAFSDAFFASGAIIDFANNNLRITHTSGKLTITGGTISYPGTATNDNAATGEVGEYFENTVDFGTAITLTSGTIANLVSRTLPAGDYDVSFMAVFAPDAGVSVASFATGVSATSATFEANPLRSKPGFFGATTTTNGNHIGETLPRNRFSLASSTTIFGIMRCTFSGGAVKGYGGWSIRRVR